MQNAFSKANKKIQSLLFFCYIWVLLGVYLCICKLVLWREDTWKLKCLILSPLKACFKIIVSWKNENWHDQTQKFIISSHVCLTKLFKVSRCLNRFWHLPDLHRKVLCKSGCSTGEKEAGGSRASCAVPCSAVNPMSKSSPAFQLVHPSMSYYSVSLSDISGTKSNMLKITISYHLLLWIYIILSSNYWLTQSLAMAKCHFK